jgi:hypothetical protein
LLKKKNQEKHANKIKSRNIPPHLMWKTIDHRILNF